LWIANFAPTDDAVDFVDFSECVRGRAKVKIGRTSASVFVTLRELIAGRERDLRDKK
jgi:hypothetical protein